MFVVVRCVPNPESAELLPVCTHPHVAWLEDTLALVLEVGMLVRYGVAT